jgi:hypothetical protein
MKNPIHLLFNFHGKGDWIHLYIEECCYSIQSDRGLIWYIRIISKLITMRPLFTQTLLGYKYLRILS